MAKNIVNPEILRIYQSKSGIRWLVLFVAVFISVSTIYYTNILVNQLKAREQRQVELFARAVEYTISENFSRDISFITEEILFQNNSIPTILVNEHGDIVSYRNIDIDSTWNDERINNVLDKELDKMSRTYDPIEVNSIDPRTDEVSFTQLIYYRNSFLLTQLTYYPYVQLSIIALFAFIAYLVFTYSKAAEQNRVWVGLAKETAHQLGTPISSLIAWMEYFKYDQKFKDSEVIAELDKDIDKLKLITERFSNIGSVPILYEENIVEVIKNSMNYLRKRISSKVTIQVESMYDAVYAKINTPLFEWVIENLCKNAVDAMSGNGTITIKVAEEGDSQIFVDISDTGKGIPKSKLKQVFQPGYSSKKRGWGLGLTLSRRIIDIYHNGKIFVKNSEVDKGTTFRIILRHKKR